MEDRSFYEKRIGTTLRGKWTLERLLGVGGMAAVYVGVHKIGRREAIKVLHPEIARSKDLRDRFEQEAHAVNLFKHPGAVEIRDIDITDDGAPFLVMELLEGESLADRARRLNGLPIDELLRYIDELLDVLVAAHAQNIVHRDIKLDNLFIQSDGRLKVLDFGIARLRTGAKAMMTRTGATLGTVAYMPPEQVKGVEIDHRADLFSVGATMFRIVAKRRIHDAHNDPDLLVKMATQPAAPLASVAPGTPSPVCMVIDRALAFQRERRYPDARTMQGDIRALRKSEEPPYATERLSAGDLPDSKEPLEGVPSLIVPLPSMKAFVDGATSATNAVDTAGIAAAEARAALGSDATSAAAPGDAAAPKAAAPVAPVRSALSQTEHTVPGSRAAAASQLPKVSKDAPTMAAPSARASAVAPVVTKNKTEVMSMPSGGFAPAPVPAAVSPAGPASMGAPGRVSAAAPMSMGAPMAGGAPMSMAAPMSAGAPMRPSAAAVATPMPVGGGGYPPPPPPFAPAATGHISHPALGAGGTIPFGSDPPPGGPAMVGTSVPPKKDNMAPLLALGGAFLVIGVGVGLWVGLSGDDTETGAASTALAPSGVPTEPPATAGVAGTPKPGTPVKLDGGVPPPTPGAVAAPQSPAGANLSPQSPTGGGTPAAAGATPAPRPGTTSQSPPVTVSQPSTGSAGTTSTSGSSNTSSTQTTSGPGKGKGKGKDKKK
jgi:serine/threonine-protein kinase